jgi:hypothetical protein
MWRRMRGRPWPGVRSKKPSIDQRRSEVFEPGGAATRPCPKVTHIRPLVRDGGALSWLVRILECCAMNRAEPVRIAILDDYQNVSLSMADWSGLDKRAANTVFNDHMADSDAVVARLQSFDIVCVMRERTPMSRAIITMMGDLGDHRIAIDLNSCGKFGRCAKIRNSDGCALRGPRGSVAGVDHTDLL